MGDPENRDAWHPWIALKGIQSDDFNDFIRQVIERRPGFVSELYCLYDQPPVRFCGRQERLAADLMHVFDELGFTYDHSLVEKMDRVNDTQSHKDAIRWDQGLRREVECLEYSAMARYGYVRTEPQDEGRKEGAS